MKQTKHNITNRELEVLTCLKAGLTNTQTADRLFVSVETIKSHRKNIKRKMSAKNSFQLALKIGESGILKFDYKPTQIAINF